MNPNKWGPHAWIFLHSITFNYPDKPTKETIIRYKNFFEALQFVIPCDICQDHYKENIIKVKLTSHALKSRKNLIEWLIDLHNEVNKTQGKKIMSYEEVIDFYVNYYESKVKYEPLSGKIVKYQSSIIPNIMSILITIIIALYFIKKKYLLNL